MNQNRRFAIYGGSFNPPGLNHSQIITQALKTFDVVVVVPCGPRSDKDSVNQISTDHRKKMVALAFGNIPRVEIDRRDLMSGEFTPTFKLEEIYKKLFPNVEIWFLIGGDLVKQEINGRSIIQNSWKQGEKIWRELNWAIMPRGDIKISTGVLPPKLIMLVAGKIFGSSSYIRKMLAEGKDIENLVSKPVENYIKVNGLYQ